MASERPQLIFGGAAIAAGNFILPEKVLSLLSLLKSSNIHRIDTAPIYPSTAPGKAEQLLGDCNPRNDGFTVDTKIMVTSMTGKGTLTPEAIDKSVSTSLARLKNDVRCIHLLGGLWLWYHYLDQRPLLPHARPRHTDLEHGRCARQSSPREAFCTGTSSLDYPTIHKLIVESTILAWTFKLQRRAGGGLHQHLRQGRVCEAKLLPRPVQCSVPQSREESATPASETWYALCCLQSARRRLP